MDTIEAKINSQLIDEYFNTQGRQFLVQTIAVGALFGTFFLRTSDYLVLGTFACIELIWFVRIWAARMYRAGRHLGGDEENWQRFVLVSIVLTALAYATGFHLVFDPADISFTVPFVVLYLGTIMGAAAFFVTIKDALNWYYAITVLNLVISLSLTEDLMYVRLAFVASLVASSGIWLGDHAHRARVGSIRDKLRNADLAQALAAQVKRAEAAEHEAVRSSLAKSRFISAASHDLRQPLHAVSLHLSVIRRDLTNPEKKPRRLAMVESLEFLSESVEMLNESLEAMLDLSTLDARSPRVKLKPVEMSRIFAQLQRTFVERAIEKGLRLQFRPTKTVVLADADLLRRALANLIDNSLKFTLAGGVWVGLRISPNRQKCAIEVRDSGVGIPPQFHESIFDEYYQLSNAGRDRERGLGLGLSIVKRLVQLQGMRLDLKSQEGRGSTFRIICDAAQGPAAPDTRPSPLIAEAPSADSAGAAIRGRKILVVDNEGAILESTRQLLAGCGASVLVARGANEAVEALVRSGPVDLALLDFRLGTDMNGAGLAKLLQARQPQPPVRAIVLTGDTQPGDMLLLRREGIQVLFKPLSGERLLQEIGRLLQD